MNRRDFLRTGAAALLGAHLAPRAGLAAPTALLPLGLNSHSLGPDDIRHCRALGITRVRTTLYTPLWQRDEGGYRAGMREGFERAHAAGLSLVVVVHNAWGDVFRSRARRSEWDRYADLFAELARRFPAVEAWQLWNEQDVWVQAPFGAGDRPRRSAEQTGRNYAQQLRLAYPRIKQANPRALVLTGGTADHKEERWRGFLRGLAAEDPACDAVAVHAYGLWPAVRAHLQAARALVGDRRPIWLTEFGNDRRPYDPAHHLATWRTVVEGNAAERLAERIYGYCLQTDPRFPEHGLLQTDGTPRPTYTWIRRQRAG